jgi:Circularly permutated YpsA SLOG family
VIFSLERALSGGTRLTLELANKLGKPVLRIYDTRKERGSNPDSLCLEIQALSDFACSNNIEILNVAGPRESKEPGVYDWALKMFRLFLNLLIGRLLEHRIHRNSRRIAGWGREEWGIGNLNFSGHRYFRLEPVG